MGRPRVVGTSGKGPRKIAMDLLGDVQGKIVLDLGAGGGFFSRELRERGASPVGCDLLDQWQFPEIPFHRADLDASLPFRDESFDRVAILEALNYVESVPHVFRECRRVLRPGGLLVVTIPNCLSLESRLKFLLNGTYRWFPHPVYASDEKQKYADLGRDPIRVTTAAFQAGLSGLGVERVLYGSSRLGFLGLIASAPLAGLAHLHNRSRKKRNKEVPTFAVGMDVLMYRNVGLLLKKPGSAG